MFVSWSCDRGYRAEPCREQENRCEAGRRLGISSELQAIVLLPHLVFKRNGVQPPGECLTMNRQVARMRRSQRQLAAWLVVAVGWVSLVATSLPSSTISAEPVTGVARLDSRHPQLRIDFEVDITPVVLEEGEFGVTLRLSPAWRSAPPEVVELGPRVVFETPAGNLESRLERIGYVTCGPECAQGGTAVVELPPGGEDAELFLFWELDAGADFDTADPPPGADLTFEATAPADTGPTWVEQLGFSITEQTPIVGSRATITTDRDIPSEALWFLAPHFRPNQPPTVMLLRIDDTTTVLSSGAAVPLDPSICGDRACVVEVYAAAEDGSTRGWQSLTALLVVAADPNLGVTVEHQPIEVAKSSLSAVPLVADPVLGIDVIRELVATFPNQFERGLSPVVQFTASGEITGVGFGEHGSLAIETPVGKLAILTGDRPSFPTVTALARCVGDQCEVRLPLRAVISPFTDTASDATAHIEVEIQAVVVHPDTPVDLPLSVILETP